MEVNKSFVLAAVLAFGLTALASEVAAAPRAIIACTTITLPGSYQLSKNLHAVGNCLVVGVNFVTIDLGGFTIFGNGSGMGIMAVGVRRGIVIRNGLITNFFDGIDLASSREIVVENLRAIANVGSGIRIGLFAFPSG